MSRPEGAGGRRRLDVAVAETFGLSRTRAQALILEGRVSLDGSRLLKAGQLIPPDAKLDLERGLAYVSRGGVKLARALAEFGWSPQGLRCVDVGASTGGFTDCLLQRGARSVTAVDVGYGQLAWTLRNDPRVKVFERCNVRHANASELGGPFEFATVDVSFISLTLLAPVLALLLEPAAMCIALVKPQFEAGRQQVGRGVVREPSVHAEVIGAVGTALASAELIPEKLTFSPLLGPAGNIEFLLGARRPLDVQNASADELMARLDVAGVVRKAHEALDR
ncbi:MAG: TlyA family RNA methyltransferase [Candidatus Eremiobacteraeota bacterium]|nr:TlyA family RNA methyltransferase [Candidatus Eremiobacteraeota bacterium]